MPNNDSPEFRQLMSDVQPLKGEAVAEVRQPHASTLAQEERRRAAVESAKLSVAEQLPEQVTDWVEPLETISWRRDGVQDGVFRRLKRGQYEIQASLNLHQHRVSQARLAVADFIQQCYQKGVRNALIIHGMGRQSKPQPALLKSLCRQWLPLLNQVLAFHSARPEHGGAGASYVIIRKNTAAKIATKELNRRR
ncbi:DNA endonuclease SmrA [Aliidiomarina minuta]|uniref:DNA endonuclease SmrA n=1 Tax=Aliidiomarina minuta TaxID=880057 RepID=A0A432W8V9_9GAMM|nr:DNA endonuclease SmrA [Aliidiomarina minuta]RUO26416.1 DNA endonuclease SmrA [Aliidiomarina minuta]